MKSGARDEAEGKLDQVKGAVKQAVGKATDDPEMLAEGDVDRAGGKVQEKVGQVKRVFGK